MEYKITFSGEMCNGVVLLITLRNIWYNCFYMVHLYEMKYILFLFQYSAGPFLGIMRKGCTLILKKF